MYFVYNGKVFLANMNKSGTAGVQEVCNVLCTKCFHISLHNMADYYVGNLKR